MLEEAAVKACEEEAAAKAQEEADVKACEEEATAKAQEEAVAKAHEEEAAAKTQEEAAAKAGVDITASPAASEVDVAFEGGVAGRDIVYATASGELQHPGTEATPENPDAIVILAAGARAPRRSSELRSAASGTGSGSMAQLQREWASTDEVSSAGGLR